MKYIRNQHGFTLVELLLYVAIVGTVLVAVSLFFALAAESRVKSQSISEVEQQGLAVMDAITSSIRKATSIDSPAAGATGASLSIVVPTANLSPTVYDISGATLQVKEGTATATPLTNAKVQVSNMIFKNLSRSGTPGVIQVTFTLSRTNLSGKNEYDYQKTFTSSASLRWP